jgi:hypothetical protein
MRQTRSAEAFLQAFAQLSAARATSFSRLPLLGSRRRAGAIGVSQPRAQRPEHRFEPLLWRP